MEYYAEKNSDDLYGDDEDDVRVTSAIGRSSAGRRGAVCGVGAGAGRRR
jgi:hypothetical protein